MTDQQTPGDDWASITLQAGSPENLAGLLIALAAVHSLDAAAAEPHPHDNCVPRHAYDKLVDRIRELEHDAEDYSRLAQALDAAHARIRELEALEAKPATPATRSPRKA